MSDQDALITALDRLVRLQAFALIDGKTQKEQLRILNGAGFSPKEIAVLLRTSANTVNVGLSKLRKEGKL